MGTVDSKLSLEPEKEVMSTDLNPPLDGEDAKMNQNKAKRKRESEDDADNESEGEEEDEDGIKQCSANMTQDQQAALSLATATKIVEDLARLSFLDKPIYVDVNKGRKKVTDEGLQHGYVIVPSEKRLVLLYSFLRRNLSKKIMVFFSSSNSVKFHSDLFQYIKIPCFDIHGKQKQQKRNSTFLDFCKAEKGILLCTDVAARGLDIPVVDWIVQYDPPDDPKEYIHRVARMENAKGIALLFLIPKELQFISYLKSEKVKVKQYEINQQKLRDVQAKLVQLISANLHLKKLAKHAYQAYILSYNSHSMKDVFKVRHLGLKAVAASFGIYCPPIASEKRKKKMRKVEADGSKHWFISQLHLRPIFSFLLGWFTK